jgi:hypothetical protein
MDQLLLYEAWEFYTIFDAPPGAAKVGFIDGHLALFLTMPRKADRRHCLQ